MPKSHIEDSPSRETIHPRIIYRNTSCVFVVPKEACVVQCRYQVHVLGLEETFVVPNPDSNTLVTTESKVVWDDEGLEAADLVTSCYRCHNSFEGLFIEDPSVFPGKRMRRGNKEIVVVSRPFGDPQALRVMTTPNYVWVQVDQLKPLKPFKKLVPFNLKTAIEHEGKYFVQGGSPATADRIIGFSRSGITYITYTGERHEMSYSRLAECKWWDTQLPCMQEVDV